MVMLEIALAIAVTMLLFSTITSMVVEVLHRVLGVRKRGLQKMLTSFYENEVQGNMARLLDKKSSSEDVSSFIKKITLTTGDTTVTTMEFIRRFAETDIGRSIGKKVDDEVNTLIDETADRYEEYGRQASQLFRRYSALVNVIVSILLAFVLNINVINIYNSLRHNEKLREDLVSHAEKAMTIYEIQAAQQGMNKTYENLDELKGDIKELQNEVKEAKELGLPIGWEKDVTFAELIAPLHWLIWILSTFITGLLIGLGGPFWYDVVKRLAPINQLAGALARSRAGKGGEQQTTTELTAEKSKTVGAVDHKEAFKQVIKAKNIIEGEGSGPDDTFLGPRAMRL